MAKRKLDDDRFITLKRRNYVPLERYCQVFNQEVKCFMDPFNRKNEFRDSVIHIDGKVRYLQDADDGKCIIETDSDKDSEDEELEIAKNYELGTCWTGKEKQMFFHCLSRYSIHTLDEWSDQLPNKSKYEILVYHDVLNTNLNQLKRMNTKKRGGILTKKELPIAYEMDPFFVELEEAYSQLIKTEIEDVVNADHKVELDSTEEGVINWHNWYKRWAPIYSRHRIQEYQPPPKEPPLFSTASEQYVEELLRRYTKKLIFYSVIPHIDKKFVSKDSLKYPDAFLEEITQRTNIEKKKRSPLVESYIWDNDEIEVRTTNLEFPHLITPSDIWKAMIVLRKTGHLMPTLPETVVDTLTKFQLEHEEGKLFKNKNIPQALIVPMLQHKVSSYKLIVGLPSHVDFKKSSPPPTSSLETHPASSPLRAISSVPSSALTILHNSKLPIRPAPPLAFEEDHLIMEKKLFSLCGKKSALLPYARFIADDPYNSTDNPFYERLFLFDALSTNALDVNNSRLYQHALVLHMHAPAEHLPHQQHSTVSLESSTTPSENDIPAAILDLYQYYG
ncbi:Rrn5p Ecym_4225 [Eremothecium cymbalariae DBVPG|uniref:Uncharacterized protein n=1 Tax=Eremothecium cymbalariae (strain CBS 270.75 / DBVPG 7215 / KCTC 17166 / NRRL Y-17582) TaxID=931890 RepID=G8JTD9_ERECY|nr:hypothetical protein Ecym_4225 [Eremothecium cymbalariae DBVPG\